MPNEIVSEALNLLVDGEDLSEEQARDVLVEIMSGRVGDAQTAAVLAALRAKGETAAEIVGLARAMVSFAEKVEFEADVILDTCGTGGGGSAHLQHLDRARRWSPPAPACRSPSTATARRPATAAAPTCSRRSACVSTCPPSDVRRCLERIGMGFMFAPLHHPAMKHVAPVRRELGIRTVFNLIGPLTNPAGARHQLIGVSDAALRRRARRGGAPDGLGSAT